MRLRLVSLFVSAGLLLGSAALAAGEKPVQLALFDPAQIVKNGESVGAARLDLIYGKNAGMNGLELGLINHTTGDQTGLTYGGLSLVQGAFVGWQDNFVNIADKSFLGLQSGAYNQSGEGHGVQFGWVNVTERMSGVQVGLVNYTRVMQKGLQVGLANFILEGGIPFLPVVNWRF